jgi:hypothetical protein
MERMRLRRILTDRCLSLLPLLCVPLNQSLFHHCYSIANFYKLPRPTVADLKALPAIPAWPGWFDMPGDRFRQHLFDAWAVTV